MQKNPKWKQSWKEYQQQIGFSTAGFDAKAERTTPTFKDEDQEKEMPEMNRIHSLTLEETHELLIHILSPSKWDKLWFYWVYRFLHQEETPTGIKL